MKPLDIKQRAFKADEITYLDRKAIQLDRMLLKLFELLRFDGRPVVRRRRRVIDVQSLVDAMHRDGNRFPGFDTHPGVARAWVSNDLFEIMNRGKGESEMVVGPRPFHLNAFKLANPSAVDDFGASMQVWAMLYYADRPLLGLLRDFFGRGLDRATDKYDLATPLDLETLAVLGLADQMTVDHATTPPPAPIRPLCLRQGHIMADDLRRILSYEDKVPRHVLAGYVRTLLGLHLALFQLRLFRLVPDRVEQAQSHIDPSECPVEAGVAAHLSMCPHSDEIIIDLTDDPTSPSALLAKASAAQHIEGISRYVRAVILLNRVKDYAAVQSATGRMPAAHTVGDLLAIIKDPPADMDGFFAARIANILTTDEGEEEEPIVTALLRVSTLSSFDKYVELVCKQRLKNERNRLITLLDALAQKNKPGGFLKQNAGARSPRWFAMGSDLLETLVQIAVLDRDADNVLRSRSLLIDDFVAWLRLRYGFVIFAPAHRAVPAEEQEAWRRNELALRERLRQIGFFTDLSDAYNSQTLRPRYMVRHND